VAVRAAVHSNVWQCAAVSGSGRQWAAVCAAERLAVCGGARRSVRYCGSLPQCGSVVMCGRAAVCGSARGNVLQCVTVCAAVGGSASSSVLQCACDSAAVCDSVRGSVRQCGSAAVGVAVRAVCAALRQCATVRGKSVEVRVDECGSLRQCAAVWPFPTVAHAAVCGSVPVRQSVGHCVQCVRHYGSVR
jgi:hypothetical protein